MIAYLSGKFSYKNPAVVYIDVNGMGYEVNISLNTWSEIQNLSEGKLFIYLQVKEDSHTLYGFFDILEKEMFVMLIGVSGVGAATARMMLSSMKPDEISKAILHDNAKLLESVKGIGRKTAERLVLELRDKVNKQSFEPGDDIAWLVPHQANKRIIDATANRMGLPIEKVMLNIQRYGNTTSATIPLCLWEWEKQLKKGDNIVLAAFGGGFTWGATLVKWAYDSD